uniref:DNA-binding protein n=1 Tax=Anoplophora glabripennis TaxID=217634 RepID=V5IAH2_ANOGL
MENEQWAAKYQQSVPTGLERTENNLNNGNTEHLSKDSKSLKNTGKDEPENDVKCPEPNLDCNPPNVTISEKAKQTIQAILEQIKSLSQIEKFLLFLKLPSEVSHAVDPFRQPLNPLGSRSEIYRTISWIKTHLEEDPDISLPKQEVYNGYYNYCEKNSVKPLSQADFGKVMKQVYPRVRARRLGTRGNSRYCYSGLRRCIKLKPPILPDLADKPLSTEAPFTQSSLTSAAWLIVRDWSEQQLGTQFSSIQALAYYLILNQSIGTGTEAATKITNAAESSLKSDDTNGKSGNKHREMQLQLQRKIQQKNEGKERKRKLQSPKSEQKPSGKKSRSQSVPAPPAVPTSPTVQLATSSGTTSGECSTASSSSTSPTQGKPICDKSLDFTQLPALPDFNSFQKPSTDGLLGNGGQETSVGASTNKVAIPRLQAAPIQLTTPPKKQQKPAKYKSIQPRLQQCDIAPYNPQSLSQATEDNRSQDLHNTDRIKERKSSDDDCDVNDFPLTRERLNSVSNIEKDAMDEYLGKSQTNYIVSPRSDTKDLCFILCCVFTKTPNYVKCFINP